MPVERRRKFPQVIVAAKWSVCLQSARCSFSLALIRRSRISISRMNRAI